MPKNRIIVKITKENLAGERVEHPMKGHPKKSPPTGEVFRSTLEVKSLKEIVEGPCGLARKGVAKGPCGKISNIAKMIKPNGPKGRK